MFTLWIATVVLSFVLLVIATPMMVQGSRARFDYNAYDAQFVSINGGLWLLLAMGTFIMAF